MVTSWVALKRPGRFVPKVAFLRTCFLFYCVFIILALLAFNTMFSLLKLFFELYDVL